VAASALAAARAGSPEALIVVDPIMGDEATGLYVHETVAAAIELRLIPRADVITPNAWELGRLVGAPVASVEDALGAARSLDRPVLVSSVPAGGEIGTLYIDASRAWIALHARARSAPRGTGDLLTALFTAARISGRSPRAALAAAVGGVAEAVAKADAAAELSVTAFPVRLSPSKQVRIERL
jgi:pyridoxine kinase